VATQKGVWPDDRCVVKARRREIVGFRGRGRGCLRDRPVKWNWDGCGCRKSRAEQSGPRTKRDGARPVERLDGGEC